MQPFIDVNKRTSRLAANIPLIRANLCTLSFVDVPEKSYTEGTLAVYELNDVALLRDVFAWAYERSCAQFKVLRQAMGAPDPIRLRYRSELRALVADVVRDRVWPPDADLLALAERYAVPAHDQATFMAAARRDLRGLRADILARYQLRMSEFDAWVEAVGALRRQEPKLSSATEIAAARPCQLTDIARHCRRRVALEPPQLGVLHRRAVERHAELLRCHRCPSYGCTTARCSTFAPFT